jgi:iron complex outermembrane receptor protein
MQCRPAGTQAGEDRLKPSAIAAAAVAFATQFALAQTSEDEIVVTATRFPEQRLDAPIGMSVITAKQIAESAAKTLPQLLSQEAGIVTRDNTGGPDSQIDLRGFGITGDQNTLVLLNGQRLNDVELTTIGWSAIPLDSIERIEILRGSGAVLYGGGATGGTINIITKAPPAGAKAASVGGSTGTYGTNEVRAGASVAGQSSGFNLFASDLNSDNYRANNRLEQKNLNGSVRLFAPQGEVSLLVDLDSQNLRLPGVRTESQLETDRRGTATPDDFSTRDGARLNLGGSYELGFGRFAADLGYRDTTRTSFFKDYTGGPFSTYTDTHSDVWSFTPRMRIPYAAAGAQHSLVVGFDVDYWDYLSRRAQSQDQLDANPSAHITATQRDAAVFAQHNSAFGQGTKLTLGARVQRTTITAQDRVNPAAYASSSKTTRPIAWEIGLRQDVTNETAVYARAGQSFRQPTVDEVYSPFGGPVGDAIVALLEPQTSHDYEIGSEYRSGALRLRASVFAMYLKNEIMFFAPTFSNVNLPATRRRGVEVDASAAVSPLVSLFGNVSVTDARFREGAVGGVDVSGNVIPLVPRLKVNAGVAWQLGPQTRLSGVARYVGTQYYDNDQENTFHKMPAYTVFDLKFAQTIDRLTLGLAINNLLNKLYYSYAIKSTFGPPTFSAYPQADQTFLLTADYRF